jgi:hypothetical protein
LASSPPCFLAKALGNIVFLNEQTSASESLSKSRNENLKNMRAELQKPGEEIDESKLGRAVKQTEAPETTDEVSAHATRVFCRCPYCNAPLHLQMDFDPQWFKCPNCGYFVQIFA